MNNKDKGCPHSEEMRMQKIWCCYKYNKMVDKEDCKKCKYGKILNNKGLLNNE